MTSIDGKCHYSVHEVMTRSRHASIVPVNLLDTKPKEVLRTHLTIQIVNFLVMER